MRLLRDVLIEAGEIERYFDGQVPVTLWRARNTTRDPHIFTLVERPFHVRGTERPADITITEEADGRRWVHVQDRPRGASTFDRPGVFRGSNWEYYKIESGTELPVGLAVVKDNYNPGFKAIHYTVAPAWDMPLEEFRRLLAVLAAKLVREAA